VGKGRRVAVTSSYFNLLAADRAPLFDFEKENVGRNWHAAVGQVPESRRLGWNGPQVAHNIRLSGSSLEALSVESLSARAGTLIRDWVF
jgi:hypothetical protein